MTNEEALYTELLSLKRHEARRIICKALSLTNRARFALSCAERAQANAAAAASGCDSNRAALSAERAKYSVESAKEVAGTIKAHSVKSLALAVHFNVYHLVGSDDSEGGAERASCFAADAAWYRGGEESLASEHAESIRHGLELYSVQDA